MFPCTDPDGVGGGGAAGVLCALGGDPRPRPLCCLPQRHPLHTLCRLQPPCQPYVRATACLFNSYFHISILHLVFTSSLWQNERENMNNVSGLSLQLSLSIFVVEYYVYMLVSGYTHT